MINPGANPKEMTSANESSCRPISERTFNTLANVPSRKSKIAAIPIKYDAKRNSPLKAKTIETHPLNRFSSVTKLGMFFRIIEFDFICPKLFMISNSYLKQACKISLFN